MAEHQDNLNPQEIAQFKEGYQIARQFVYQEPVFNGLVQDLQKGDPVDVFASVIVTVMLRVQESVGQLPLSVAAALGIALIDDVTQAAEETGVTQSPPQQAVLQAAVILWLQSNDYPPQQVAQELQQIGAPPEMIQAIQQQTAPQSQQAPTQQASPQPHQPPGMGKPARGLLQRSV